MKNKSKFFPDEDNNNKLNTFFEKHWNINLKEKNYTKQPLAQRKTSLKNILKNEENIIVKETNKRSVVILNKTL